MDYYINQFGDDSYVGSSKTHPWRSIARVNAAQLRPGDSVRFHANQTFTGNLMLSETDTTGGCKPITIGSYGNGRATLKAGIGPGLLAKNIGGINVQGLNFVGAGEASNTSSGISFVTDLPGGIKLAHLRVHQVSVCGFKQSGICIMAQPIDGSWSGFEDVRITHANVHDNGDAGICCFGAWNPERRGYAHTKVYVAHCEVYRNTGIPGKGSHSGNGIVLSQVEDAMIEHCHAYENGGLNDYEGGGPVGIWAWDANRVVIQLNESHHNRTGSSKDGGGFDLDGGVRNSIVQYNYSHDNDGPGYQLAQFEGARTFHDNVLRYNLSVNDARKNSYGGIHLWSCGANGGIRDTVFHNNKVVIGESTAGNPTAVDCRSAGICNISFCNNLFVAHGECPLVRGESSTNVRFTDNVYRSVR